MAQAYTVEVVDDPETILVEIQGSELPPGGQTNQVLAKLSDLDGHVGWVDASSLAGSFTVFASITDLLAVDSRTWKDGRTFNSYGLTIYAGWDRILKTDSAAAYLTANGDSVLDTDDGLSFAVRRFAVSL